ncbi:MAG: hypothetical protein AAGD07_24485 [Planctomycetota bacterium]
MLQEQRAEALATIEELRRSRQTTETSAETIDRSDRGEKKQLLALPEITGKEDQPDMDIWIRLAKQQGPHTRTQFDIYTLGKLMHKHYHVVESAMHARLFELRDENPTERDNIPFAVQHPELELSKRALQWEKDTNREAYMYGLDMLAEMCPDTQTPAMKVADYYDVTQASCADDVHECTVKHYYAAQKLALKRAQGDKRNRELMGETFQRDTLVRGLTPVIKKKLENLMAVTDVKAEPQKLDEIVRMAMNIEAKLNVQEKCASLKDMEEEKTKRSLRSKVKSKDPPALPVESKQTKKKDPTK